MASQPPANNAMPLFYGNVMPLSSDLHPTHGLKPAANLAFAAGTHAIPVTVDEFTVVQRHYPIVFGVGDNPAPLALVGLQEGSNLFIGADNMWEAGVYVPAFVRRYPFMLARLNPQSQELSLCFDDTAGIIVPDEGERMFDDNKQPTERTKSILDFCRQFEEAVARTRMFMEEITKLDLIMDGEVQIQREGLEQPAVYRGFRMIDEQKLQNIRGDQARKMVQNGMLGLAYAHLFSLSLISPLFERQFAASQSPKAA
jgi:hypothetical protein